MTPKIGELWNLQAPDLASLGTELVLILELLPEKIEWSIYSASRVRVLCLVTKERIFGKTTTIPVHWLGEKIS